MASVRLAFALLLFGLGTTAASGQTSSPDGPKSVPDTVLRRVTTAFIDGNAQLLLSPAADRVEVSLFGTRTFYSSAQAFYVLREFFDTHTPSSFALSDATGAGRSCFVRGRLDHAHGERTLQVYVRLVQRSDVWQLHEVRIDADVE
ncbi:hypothetical protein BSZ35_13055 [Salinibacter sp. 10B]|uniref:DUF4783 domain-containing protein n=1 Tax=Salinibacter sp. 10B TaxID=1923971 RepID=UPI000CF4DF43|nr:DUF4783 domain-containing protein [Salinibacter sp. 10B]PQJ35407.1 hypothetical protein BSZ35_13055 [Salinibacter sp. 10B]